jgi:alcohol dehydrogenase class IV
MTMETIAALRKYVIPEIIYGFDALELAGQSAQRFALGRVLVVSDSGVVEAGWANKVIASLNQAGITTELFCSITPNPKDHEVMAGVECYHAAKCNGIIAVGGGSAMDGAKGIGIVCSNGGNILDYEGVDQIQAPMPPLICIPTTAGTAADISQFAIITSTSDNRKIAIISKSVVPDLALIDPLTTTTMDSSLTATTGIDALVHAIEAYVSTAHSPFTDLQALHAIQLITENLLKALANPSDTAARNNMMLASTEAGMAFSNASLGAVHAMAHSLGGLLDSPHGDCNALLLEHVIKFNFRSALTRYRRITEAFGLNLSDRNDDDACRLLIQAVHDLRIKAGVTGSLAQRGVLQEHLSGLARYAMQDACMVTNPRRPSHQEIEAIYAAAL